MPAPALIFEKVTGPPTPERLLTLNTRSLMAYPFEATNWTDLRVGFFLSLTGAVADDTPGGALADTITTVAGQLPFSEYFFIGVIDRTTGQTFMGFSNCQPIRGQGYSQGNSMLVSSDGGIGTTNAFFWRPKNSLSDNYSLLVTDGALRLSIGGNGSQIHFAQVPASAGGYATLLALRLQRDSGTSRTISMTVKRDITNHNGDVLFSNDPTTALLKSYLDNFPTTVQQLGPFELTHVPDALYLYWPFSKTRLRCHLLGLVKRA